MITLIKQFLFSQRSMKTNVGPNQDSDQQARYLMLDLINRERNRVGSPPVALADNTAAQRHADACHSMGVGSHWNLEGLKPYMRYSLTGGCQNNGENCYQHVRVGNAGPGDIAGSINLAMKGWMASPGHRTTILDPWHRKVSVGIHWTASQFAAIQDFEGDYLDFTVYPAVSGGVLEFSGRVKNGVNLSTPDDLIAELWFDPPPAPLTVGQLLRVNGYDNGIPVARLRRVLPDGYFWEQNSFTAQFIRMRSPEQLSRDVTIPKSLFDRKSMIESAYKGNQHAERLEIDVPLIDAEEWRVSASGFSVRTDVGPVLDQWGNGVYSLLLYSPMASSPEMVNFSQFSMFLY